MSSNRSYCLLFILTTSCESYTNDQKHLKRCPTSFVISEIQIKAIMKYYFIPTNTAKIQTQVTNVARMWINWDSHTPLAEM